MCPGSSPRIGYSELSFAQPLLSARDRRAISRSVRRPVSSGITKRESRHTFQEVCPFTAKVSTTSSEPAFASRGPARNAGNPSR